jgi:hypothetical protein
MRGPALGCRRANILIIRLRKEVSKQGLDVDRGNHRRVSIAELAAKDPPFNSH